MSVCSNFAAGLTISDEEIENTEIATRGQSQNENWLQFRSGRVTASFFGEVKQKWNFKTERKSQFLSTDSRRHGSEKLAMERLSGVHLLRGGMKIYTLCGSVSIQFTGEI